MADIAVGGVTPGATADVRTGTAGGTVTAGNAVILDSAGALIRGKADNSTTATVHGIALHDAIDGQPLAYQVSGALTIAAVATVGTVYVLSASASGAIAPWADLTSAQRVSILGVATAATEIEVKILNSGVAIP